MEDTIVGRIFDLMHEKGITQKQIADKLGIKQGTVAGWKQRNCPPPINYISDISEILEVSIDYLVTGNIKPMSYKLDSSEQYLVRLFRCSSEENKKIILSVATGLSDKNYYENINPQELLKTLNP